MKRRFTKSLAFGFATIFAGVMFTSTASASSRGPLYEASDNYRDAVCDFEGHVLRLRYIEREDRRLVDQLEDATSRLRSDARRASDLDLRALERLNGTWAEIESLHHTVEIALFDQPSYPCNPTLEACWARVDMAHRQFGLVLGRANAIAAEQQASMHNHAISRLSISPPVAAPIHYESYRQRVAPIPSYRSPSSPTPTDRFRSTPIRSTPSSGFDHSRNQVSPYGEASLGQERYIGRQTYRQPGLQRIESRDVGAALVGALLSRVLQ
ncbi:hypothetical protein Q31b_08480 [Novipirellula aureliae]|uniref:DUF5667 domain-containing protein n=1 Tax=Novipirellula aureliae TaxID=2527966 RepID=A0A5C6E9L5_9BACT|nr:hypothetical protein [Novipirellula aureliae]TWU45672.1 hypothetical protein Q31b_08480 [Novipirellula aureliae]